MKYMVKSVAFFLFSNKINSQIITLVSRSGFFITFEVPNHILVRVS